MTVVNIGKTEDYNMDDYVIIAKSIYKDKDGFFQFGIWTVDKDGEVIKEFN